jgi:copper(I)-binding protein
MTALLFVAGLAAGAYGGPAAAVFTVSEPWVLPTSGRDTEAYMELASSEGSTLVGARSKVAARVDVRTREATKAAAGLPLPARMPVMLAPAKDRLVLRQLDRKLKVGDRVPITLLLRDEKGVTTEIEVDAEVRLRSPTDDERRGHRHGG